MTTAGSGSTGRWVIVLVLALVVAVGLTALVIRQPGGATGRPGRSGITVGFAGEPTARETYPAALEAAQAWQADASPAVISAHWRPRRGHWPTSLWMFQFYSPSTHRTAVVVVEDRRARLLQETLSPYALPTFTDDEWQVDSSTALQVWWEKVGATFLALHPDMDLAAQLRVEEGGERLVWIVTGIAGEQVRVVTINGTTGEPVED